MMVRREVIRKHLQHHLADLRLLIQTFATFL